MAAAPKARTIALNPAFLGRKNLELCPHAVQRAKERRITDSDIIHTIRFPDKTGLKTKVPRIRVRWQKNALRAIDVVYTLKSDKIVVVTVVATN